MTSFAPEFAWSADAPVHLGDLAAVSIALAFAAVVLAFVVREPGGGARSARSCSSSGSSTASSGHSCSSRRSRSCGSQRSDRRS